MTRDLFDPLDLELRRMLRDLHDGPPAPREARARLRGALQLGGPFPPDGSGPEGAPIGNLAARSAAQTAAGARLAKTATHVSRAWAVSGMGAAALIGGWFALGPQGSDASDRSIEQPPALQENASERRTAAPPVIGPPETVGSSVAGRGDAPVEAPETSPPSSSVPETTPSSASSAKSEKRGAESSLAAERRLLDAARAALVAGDSETGLDRLGRHARQFPRGVLAEERAALTVDALVAAGRYDEAKRRADAFSTRYPGSIFAPSVAAALQVIP